MVTHAEGGKGSWGQGAEAQVGHTGAIASPPPPSPSFLFPFSSPFGSEIVKITTSD